MANSEEHTLHALYNNKKQQNVSTKYRSISEFPTQKLYRDYRNMFRREARLSYLLDEASEMILAIDPTQQILVVNKEARELFEDQTNFEDENLYLFEHLSQNLIDLWKSIWDKAKKGQPFEDKFEFEIAGIQRKYELCYKPQYNKKEELIELWFFCRDVTQEEFTQDLIDSKQTMLESISNSVQEGIFRSSKEEGIIYVNQAFARMFGYDSPKELMKVEPSELYMNPSRREEFVDIIKEKGSFFNEEVEFKRKDGSSFWGLVSSVPVTDKFGKRFNDGAVRDVTQLKEVERGLKENYAELQKVNQELDRFVYSTSHDLRAPLVSIAGLINITRIEENEALRQKYLGLMDTSIQKLDEFIKDIIGYSRNSRLEVKHEEIDFETILHKAFEALSPKDDSHSIKTSLEIESSGKFFSDKFRLTTIFNNLLSNAFRYYDPQKEDPFISVRIKQEETRVIIHVKDNGIGIEEKYLDKIFQMFYRATQKSKGSGIGLYIVKEAIEKLNGSIEAFSTHGEGTEFVLEIPQGAEDGLSDLKSEMQRAE